MADQSDLPTGEKKLPADLQPPQFTPPPLPGQMLGAAKPVMFTPPPLPVMPANPLKPGSFPGPLVPMGQSPPPFAPSGLPVGLPGQSSTPPANFSGPPIFKPSLPPQSSGDGAKLGALDGPPRFSFQPIPPPQESDKKALFGPQVGLQPSGEVPKPPVFPSSSMPPVPVGPPKNPANFAMSSQAAPSKAINEEKKSAPTPAFTPPIYQFNPSPSLPLQPARPMAEPKLFKLLRDLANLKDDGENWACPKCTLESTLEFIQCEACGHVNEPLKGVLTALNSPGKMREKTLIEKGGETVKSFFGKIF